MKIKLEDRINGSELNKFKTYLGKTQSGIWLVIQKINERSWQGVCFTHCQMPYAPKESTRNMLLVNWDELHEYDDNADMRKDIMSILKTGRIEQ